MEKTKQKRSLLWITFERMLSLMSLYFHLAHVCFTRAHTRTHARTNLSESLEFHFDLAELYLCLLELLSQSAIFLQHLHIQLRR